MTPAQYKALKDKEAAAEKKVGGASIDIQSANREQRDAGTSLLQLGDILVLGGPLTHSPSIADTPPPPLPTAVTAAKSTTSCASFTPAHNRKTLGRAARVASRWGRVLAELPCTVCSNHHRAQTKRTPLPTAPRPSTLSPQSHYPIDQSRSMTSFQLAMERGEAQHLMPVDPEEVRKGNIALKDGEQEGVSRHRLTASPHGVASRRGVASRPCQCQDHPPAGDPRMHGGLADVSRRSTLVMQRRSG